MKERRPLLRLFRIKRQLHLGLRFERGDLAGGGRSRCIFRPDKTTRHTHR